MNSQAPVFGDIVIFTSEREEGEKNEIIQTDFSTSLNEIRDSINVLEEATSVLFDRVSTNSPMSMLDFNVAACATGLATRITDIRQKANNMVLTSKNEQQLAYKKAIVQVINAKMARTTSEIQSCLTRVSAKAEEDNKRVSRFVSSEATTFDPSIYTQDYVGKTEATWDIRGVERMGRTISNVTSMLGVFNAALEAQKAQLLTVENDMEIAETDVDTGNMYLNKALGHYRRHRKIILIIQFVIFIMMLILLFKK